YEEIQFEKIEEFTKEVSPLLEKMLPENPRVNIDVEGLDHPKKATVISPQVDLFDQNFEPSEEILDTAAEILEKAHKFDLDLKAVTRKPFDKLSKQISDNIKTRIN